MARNPKPSTATPAAPATAPHDPLDRTLSYRLHLLHKITDHESQRAYVADAGLSMSDGRCLAAIGAFEPMSVNDLARLANLNKGQASRAAQSLVDQGLVRKAASSVDARGVVLTLSAAGRRKWQRAMAVIDQRNTAIFGCLSEREQATLSKMFDRLIAHARTEAAE
jgi:DNA-binding MarR family transcriptional regulator